MGKQWKQWEDFIFLDSQITADGNCSHEIKRCLLFRRKVMMKLDSIWKSRDITLPTKVCLVKAMVFPVVMHGCQSWTIKKAEHQRIDAFELWCLRRLLRVPWTARWRREWQPTPVFLSGKSHGWRSLVGYSPWACKELDTTEWLHLLTSLTWTARRSNQ